MLFVWFVLSGSSACIEIFNEKERLVFLYLMDLRLVISAKVSSCLLRIILAIAVMCFSTVVQSTVALRHSQQQICLTLLQLCQFFSYAIKFNQVEVS